MNEQRYCAFIDVLGYGALVKDTSLPVEERIRLLESIYVNLATQFSGVINQVNGFYRSDIFVRSFSDSFYLDCSNIEILIVAVRMIFENTLHFYRTFPEDMQRTPLLRCGITKNWLVKFRDIGALTKGVNDLNAVGLAVAEAYYTAEKTYLSGMRVIITPEAFADLSALENTFKGFKCFQKSIMTFEVAIDYQFKHISKNERRERCKDAKDDSTNLYELLWPSGLISDDLAGCLSILNKIKTNFPGAVIRHHQKTAGVFRDSFLISRWRIGDADYFSRFKAQFDTMC
jgi:hypothetical protein